MSGWLKDLCKNIYLIQDIFVRYLLASSDMFGWLRNLYKNVDLIQDIFYKFRNVWLAKNFYKFSDIFIEVLQD